MNNSYKSHITLSKLIMSYLSFIEYPTDIFLANIEYFVDTLRREKMHHSMHLSKEFSKQNFAVKNFGKQRRYFKKTQKSYKRENWKQI